MVFSFIQLPLFLKYLKITNLSVKEELKSTKSRQGHEGPAFLYKACAQAGRLGSF
jgi:hypothetical protein